jgi:hypothetical protein
MIGTASLYQRGISSLEKRSGFWKRQYLHMLVEIDEVNKDMGHEVLALIELPVVYLANLRSGPLSSTPYPRPQTSEVVEKVGS